MSKEESETIELRRYAQMPMLYTTSDRVSPRLQLPEPMFAYFTKALLVRALFIAQPPRRWDDFHVYQHRPDFSADYYASSANRPWSAPEGKLIFHQPVQVTGVLFWEYLEPIGKRDIELQGQRHWEQKLNV